MGVIPLEDKTFVIGDLHFYDVGSKWHKNYLQDCIDFTQQIINKVESLRPTRVIFTGDLVGRTKEKSVKNRDSLLYLIMFFKKLNDLTNGQVYSVRGNHDFSETFTDFDLLVSLGYIKRVKEIETKNVKFHLLDYGHIKDNIEVKSGNAVNIAIVHDTVVVDGKTTWFYYQEGYELSSLTNLKGVSYVLGGHIHRPSPMTVTTSIGDSKIGLFYLGNGTRPAYEKDLWETCYGVLITDDLGDVGSVLLDVVEFTLPSVKDSFYEKEFKVSDIEVLEEDNTVTIDKLSETLSMIRQYNLISGSSYKDKIRQLGGIDEEAVNLALKYVEYSENKLK